MLLDAWHAASRRAFDTDGAWAARGRVGMPLLDAMLREPYFALPPPKSTGRDLFDRWRWRRIELRPRSAHGDMDVARSMEALTLD